jgi:hypothetical protein
VHRTFQQKYNHYSLAFVCGVAGLTAPEEHKLKYSVPAEIGSSSLIVSGRSVTTEGARSSAVKTAICEPKLAISETFIDYSIVVALANDI